MYQHAAASTGAVAFACLSVLESKSKWTFYQHIWSSLCDAIENNAFLLIYLKFCMTRTTSPSPPPRRSCWNILIQYSFDFSFLLFLPPFQCVVVAWIHHHFFSLFFSFPLTNITFLPFVFLSLAFCSFPLKCHLFALQ